MAVNDQVLRLSRDLRRGLTQTTDAQALALTRAWVQAWDDLAPMFQQAADELMAAAVDGRVTPSMIIRSQLLEAALTQARETLDVLGGTVVDTLTADVQQVILDALEGQQAIVQAQLPTNQASLVASVVTANPEALAAMVERTTERITSTAYPLPRDVEQIMRQELVKAMAVGDSPRRAAAGMVQRAGATFDGGLSRALTISRTEMLDANRAAIQAQELQNADIMGGWEWEAALDVRTCPSCLSMHGTRHPITEPGPLDHPNGRCDRISVTKSWKELGFDIAEPESLARDAQDWFENLTPDTQLQIMGPTRLELLQSGAVQWSDLATRTTNPGWRDSYQATTVQALRGLAE